MKASKKHNSPPPEPPAHLSERSQALWRLLVPSHAVSIGRLELLTVALEARDRMDAARLAIDKEGMTAKTETTGCIHLHPLLKVEKDARQQFLQAWSKLGLSWDAFADGRLSE